MQTGRPPPEYGTPPTQSRPGGGIVNGGTDERAEMVDTVVWATDGSDEAERALHEALRLEPRRLVAVHCEHRGVEPQTEAIARRVAALQEEGHEIELVVRRSDDDDPSSMAAVAAELGADMIVCGASGRRTTAGALVGPFTRGLLHLAPCPVLVVGARVPAKV